ncbi:Hypothetical protein Minf_2112 [Methylacidiphilum infernorum V4]|uniref:Uncharacterized protein n=1 Tax=Methylacidiphilum infernorum (isolate V4) TaxID=481448 RepID=B3DZ74_METI4|nr:Hypothetical protein Minf_2112 [Methylacidiphilum infernorum V4]
MTILKGPEWKRQENLRFSGKEILPLSLARYARLGFSTVRSTGGLAYGKVICVYLNFLYLESEAFGGFGL